jgi:membrane-associated protein
LLNLCKIEIIEAMFNSPVELLALLEKYKYLLIFPIMILEGPIITVISGFLASLGKLDPYYAYPLLVIGDFVGDVFHYGFGKYFQKFSFFQKALNFLGYDDEREKMIEEHFRKHSGKTLIASKISHGIGGFVQIVAGMVGVDFWEFMKFSFFGTVPKILILFFLGYYLGSSYVKIDTYFDYTALFTTFLLTIVLLYLLSKKYVNSFLKSADKDGQNK